MTNTLNQYYLQQMGLKLWTKRDLDSSENKFSQLTSEVSNCRKCSLHEGRTQTVFSRGNPKASLMVIGEAPGFYEDKQGLPFVGKAGGLLNQMLKSIGLGEDDVYIANVLKCRPPGNRDPNQDEIAQCTPFLSQQIELVSPKILLALGRFAGQFIVKKNIPLNQLRTQLHYHQAIPCIISYHPAYLLRKPSDKKNAYADLLKVKGFLTHNS